MQLNLVGQIIRFHQEITLTIINSNSMETANKNMWGLETGKRVYASSFLLKLLNKKWQAVHWQVCHGGCLRMVRMVLAPWYMALPQPCFIANISKQYTSPLVGSLVCQRWTFLYFYKASRWFSNMHWSEKPCITALISYVDTNSGVESIDQQQCDIFFGHIKMYTCLYQGLLI